MRKGLKKLRDLIRGHRKQIAAAVLVLCVVSVLTAALTLPGYIRNRRERTVQLPVILYHDVTVEHIDWPVMVSTEVLDRQMKLLADGGWHSVTLQQLTDYVDRGTPLPEKPVLITFDDGYASNLELAGPILEKYGLHAAIAVIGRTCGQELYPYTGEPMDIPRFSMEDARPWAEKGVFEFISHSWDMHLDKDNPYTGRFGMLRKKGESSGDYEKALLEDMEKERALFREGGLPDFNAVSYPMGQYTRQTDEILAGAGIRITLTTKYGTNLLVQGNPRSLYRLRRYYVGEGTEDGELVKLLTKQKKNMVDWVLTALGAELWP